MYSPTNLLQQQANAYPAHISPRMYSGLLPTVSVTSPSAVHTMPLVVPGIQSNDKDLTTEWMNKLMGKKLGDSHDEVVSPYKQRLASKNGWANH
jgi:hypothetical protein